jgi:hypothetical protein
MIRCSLVLTREEARCSLSSVLSLSLAPLPPLGLTLLLLLLLMLTATRDRSLCADRS